MHTVAQIIEELKDMKYGAEGLPYITVRQEVVDSVISLLSQQAVVEQTDEEWACDYATGYFISSECYDAQKDAALAGCNHVRQQLSKEQVLKELNQSI